MTFMSNSPSSEWASRIGVASLGFFVGWLVIYFVRRFTTFTPQLLSATVSIVVGGAVGKWFLRAKAAVLYYYPIGLWSRSSCTTSCIFGKLVILCFCPHCQGTSPCPVPSKNYFAIPCHQTREIVIGAPASAASGAGGSRSHRHLQSGRLAHSCLCYSRTSRFQSFYQDTATH